MRWAIALLLAQAAAPRGGLYTLPPLSATTLGGVKGTGAAIACAGTDKVTGFNASGVIQCGADAGGSASPGGLSGNVQVNDGLGGFGAYAGSSCAYAVKSLDASGAASCTAAPSIPADVSGKKYLIQTADAALPNAQVMGVLGTGLVKNATTSGVQSIAAAGTDYGPPTSGNATGLVLSTTTTGAHTTYGGTSCTNQFPRSLNASGAATCASIAGADLPNPSASTLGGVQSLAVVASKWINTISTSGVPSATQPVLTDISGAPVKTFVTADVNVTSATASLITGLTLTVAASTSYGFSCNIVETNTSTSAMRYAVSTPASPTTVSAMVTHFTTVLTSAVTEALTGAWATTCTNCTAAVATSVSATTHLTELNGVVLNGANTGSIQIFAAASTGAQANVVKKGSYCEWWTP